MGRIPLGYLDPNGKTGFHQQIKIEATNASRDLAEALIDHFPPALPLSGYSAYRCELFQPRIRDRFTA